MIATAIVVSDRGWARMDGQALGTRRCGTVAEMDVAIGITPLEDLGCSDLRRDQGTP